MTVQCHRCGRELTGDRIGVRAACAGCGSPLHCCRTCDFHAPGVANECREPNAEHVPDKDQANFCDHFRPAPTHPHPPKTASPDARARLDALFGKKAPP